MKQAFYVAVAVLALIGALSLLTPVLIRLSGGCFTQRLSTVTSPGGRAVATLELAQCKNDHPSGILVWVAVPPDTTQRLVMRAPPQSTDVRLTWQNDHSLMVIYPETVHPETKWSGFSSRRDGGISSLQCLLAELRAHRAAARQS